MPEIKCKVELQIEKAKRIIKFKHRKGRRLILYFFIFNI